MALSRKITEYLSRDISMNLILHPGWDITAAQAHSSPAFCISTQ